MWINHVLTCNVYISGELRLGTDESVFNAVLCSRSFTQLAAIFQEYQFLTGHDIDDAIKAEFSGDMEKALRAIGKILSEWIFDLQDIIERNVF